METKPDKAGTEKKENEVVSWIQIILVSIIIVIILNTFIFRNVNVFGESMTPYLNEKDRIVLSIYDRNYKYGDIVAIRRKAEKPLVKRVIATEGQTIDINFETGVVTVDGKVLDEPYIKEITKRDLGAKFPITVPEGHLFVMGDNRNYSDDSRNPFIGTVDTRYVFGKAAFRLLPFKSMGSLNLEKANAYGEKYQKEQEALNNPK